MDAIVTFLKNNQWSNFYQSLLSQYQTRGQLSARQIECIEAAMLKASQPREPAKPREYSIQPGAFIEVKAWIARRLQADLNMQYFFRNLEIVEIKNETAKAYQVQVKFVSKIVTSCHICGKELDTDVSRATGIGPTCAKRLGIPRPTLATANDTLALIDGLCQSLGVVGPIWIPKSQIKMGGE